MREARQNVNKSADTNQKSQVCVKSFYRIEIHDLYQRTRPNWQVSSVYRGVRTVFTRQQRTNANQNRRRYGRRL